MPLGIPAPNRTGACGQPPPCRFSGAIGLGVLGQPSASIADAGAAPVTFAEVKQNVDKRCHVCHSAEPPAPGVAGTPKGVMFDTPAQIKRLAPQIMRRR
jgi:uncharacterized membrane protein